MTYRDINTTHAVKYMNIIRDQWHTADLHNIKGIIGRKILLKTQPPYKEKNTFTPFLSS